MLPRAAVLLLLAPCLSAAPPKLKVNEVREIAPGVFFRYSAISPTDPSVFGGSNHAWVVFEDYVVVIDANFPKEAKDVVAAIKKTTNKPIRYVLDTHHHGDHAWGNAVWIAEGATVIAHRNCAKLLRQTGPADFLAAGKGKAGRKDVADSSLKFPTLIFDDKLVLDDGKQRVEFYQLGHSHTIGDAVAYLPKHKILCTGDACVNGPYNYMGHSSSEGWIRALERMQEFDIDLVVPGHGQLEDKGLLAKQKRYFQDLRALVKKGIDEGKEVEDIAKSIDLPWYKEWTTVKPASDNVRHVWNEYMGLVSPWDFEYDYGILAGPSPTKDTPGWTKPKKIVVHPDSMARLKRVAPDIEFLPARTVEEAVKLAKDADAVIGFAAPEYAAAGSKVRWVQIRSEEREKLGPIPAGRMFTVTDGRRADGPQVADQTFALLLQATRRLAGKPAMPPVELRGKTMLIVGSGDTAEQVAKRAGGFGMKVVQAADGFDDRFASADVVVLAVPLMEKTRGIIGAKQLAAMKKGAMLINGVHAALIDAAALAKAEPGRVIVAMDGVVGKLVGPDTSERRFRLQRENVRRFAAGEPLLGVVE